MISRLLRMGRARTAGLGALALFVALGLSAQAAGALICPDPDPVGDFRRAVLSQESFVVMHGTLSSIGPGYEAGDRITFAMAITGRTLGRGGFEGRRMVSFDYVADCGIALSCPVAPPLGEALVFLRRTTEGLVLEPGLCSETAHFGVDRRVLDGIEACFLRGTC